MGWLRKHAWWGLLFVTVTLCLFGVTDIFMGSAADSGIPLGLIGLSPDALRAQSEAGYRIFDFFTRSQGFALLMLGLLGTAILLFAYRRDQRWAWWTMWALPAWAVGIFALYLAFGVDASQPAPPPMLSAPGFVIFTSVVQLVSAPRFFRTASATS